MAEIIGNIMSYDMTPEQIVNKVEEWIDNLENNSEYIQGKHNLRNYNINTGELNYCCLGVLGDLLPQCTFEESEAKNNSALTSLVKKCYFEEDSQWISIKFLFQDSLQFLQHDYNFEEWLATKNKSTFHIRFSKPIEDTLMMFNDEWHLSFKDIAEFLKLFYLPYLKERLGFIEVVL